MVVNSFSLDGSFKLTLDGERVDIKIAKSKLPPRFFRKTIRQMEEWLEENMGNKIRILAYIV